MSKEIERKFLVISPPLFLSKLPSKNIQQGYLAINQNGTEVRVRKKGNAYLLTVKSAGTLERTEVELSISAEEFNQLLPLTEDVQIVKERFELQLSDQLIEIDVFKGKLNGLILAEIEFDSLSLANSFIPFDWMDKEVTEVPIFKNKNLAQVADLTSIKPYL